MMLMCWMTLMLLALLHHRPGCRRLVLLRHLEVYHLAVFHQLEGRHRLGAFHHLRG